MNTNKNTNNHKDTIRFLVVTSFLLMSFGVLAPTAYGVRVYFDPLPTAYEVGDSFVLSVELDTEGQPINAIDISIRTPKLVRIKNISKSGSIIQLWISEPSFSGETISLTGGIPGGTTTSKGVIAKVAFEAAAVGEGNIALVPGSSVLLNDGQGTKLDLQTAGGPVFQVIPKPKETATTFPEPAKSPEETPKETPEETPQETAEKKDNKKPERFEILIGEDPRVFNGQKFISFFASDKDTGIDHYEVKEGRGDYKIAQSPYLLSDQEKMRTVIRVRAYDTAGNYRESIYPGLLKRIWWQLLRIFGGLITAFSNLV